MQKYKILSEWFEYDEARGTFTRYAKVNEEEDGTPFVVYFQITKGKTDSIFNNGWKKVEK